MSLPHGNRIAIITLSRDNPGELFTTVRSVQLQSTPPDQHIVLDSSEKAHQQEMRAIAEAGGAEYHWVEPRGIYPAMHHSLSLPKPGSYLWWLNSSDRLAGKNSVESAKAAIDSSQKERAGHWVIGQLIRAKKNHKGLHRIGHDASTFARRLSEGATGFPHPSTLFFSESVDSDTAYTGGRKIAEDYALGLDFLNRWGTPWISDQPLAVHVPDGFSYHQPVRNAVEKISARAELSKGWSPLNEARVLVRTVPRSLRERLTGRLGWDVPLQKWQQVDWGNVHFCSPETRAEWPSCCEAVIGSLPHHPK